MYGWEATNKQAERKERLESCKAIYRNYGYTEEKDFPGEYYFMFNSATGECVRLYYNGHVREYHK